MSQNCIVSVKFLRDIRNIVISSKMQHIGNKKVIHDQTTEIICNTFDYMRITFPFEPVTKIKEWISECTKASLRSVKRILKQRKDSAERNNGIPILNSPPKRHRKCTVTNLEKYELGDFRTYYKYYIFIAFIRIYFSIYLTKI
jgi:hypothetical protein